MAQRAGGNPPTLSQYYSNLIQLEIVLRLLEFYTNGARNAETGGWEGGKKEKKTNIMAYVQGTFDP